MVGARPGAPRRSPSGVHASRSRSPPSAARPAPMRVSLAPYKKAPTQAAGVETIRPTRPRPRHPPTTAAHSSQQLVASTAGAPPPDSSTSRPYSSGVSGPHEQPPNMGVFKALCLAAAVAVAAVASGAAAQQGTASTPVDTFKRGAGGGRPYDDSGARGEPVPAGVGYAAPAGFKAKPGAVPIGFVNGAPPFFQGWCPLYLCGTWTYQMPVYYTWYDWDWEKVGAPTGEGGFFVTKSSLVRWCPKCSSRTARKFVPVKLPVFCKWNYRGHKGR